MNAQDLFMALQAGYGPSQALTQARNINQQPPVSLGALTQPEPPAPTPSEASNPSEPSSGVGVAPGVAGNPGFGGSSSAPGIGGSSPGVGMGSASAPTGINGMVADPNGAATVAGLMADAIGMMSPGITGMTGFGANPATPNDIAQAEEAGVAGLIGGTFSGPAEFGGWSGMDVAQAIADAFSGYSESGFSGESGESGDGDGDGSGDGW